MLFVTDSLKNNVRSCLHLHIRSVKRNVLVLLFPHTMLLLLVLLIWVTVQSTAHPSAQVPSTSSQPVSYVTSAQFEEMNDKWAEHFAIFEALLSRGNVFTTPKFSVPVSSHPVLPGLPVR